MQDAIFNTFGVQDGLVRWDIEAAIYHVMTKAVKLNCIANQLRHTVHVSRGWHLHMCMHDLVDARKHAV